MPGQFSIIVSTPNIAAHSFPNAFVTSAPFPAKLVAPIIKITASQTPPKAFIYFLIFAIFATEKIVPTITAPTVATHLVICHHDGSATTGKAVFSSKSTT